MIDQETINLIAELRVWAKYGKLLSGVIHNLNTPLMGISGRVELLQFKMPDLKGLDQIASQLERINNSLGNLTFMIEKDCGEETTSIDLSEYITNITTFMNTNMQFKHKTDVQVNINEVTLKTKLNILNNVIIEIINNCLEAFEDRGTLIIKGYVEGDNINLDFTSLKTQISQEVLNNMGSPFNTTKQGSAGLGFILIRKNLKTINGDFQIMNTSEGVLTRVILPQK